MNIFTKSLTITILGTAIGLSSVAYAGPIPLPTPKPVQVSDVQDVQFRRLPRRGFYNGQRGYRDYRRGYRRHSDGYWYPLAAFGAGALIGGALASPPRAYGGSSHVQWCADRYQTYRASDNTYVPRAGVRAQCNSPYN